MVILDIYVNKCQSSVLSIAIRGDYERWNDDKAIHGLFYTKLKKKKISMKLLLIIVALILLLS